MELPKGKSLESIIEPNPNNNKTPFNSNVKNLKFFYLFFVRMLGLVIRL